MVPTVVETGVVVVEVVGVGVVVVVVVVVILFVVIVVVVVVGSVPFDVVVVSFVTVISVDDTPLSVVNSAVSSVVAWVVLMVTGASVSSLAVVFKTWSMNSLASVVDLLFVNSFLLEELV